ncbi:MAG: tetratricopeptide repeat protein [Anaerolineales bacterium]|nr:tetratricopeptide repeat protein [Anaerolineales bacterium]
MASEQFIQIVQENIICWQQRLTQEGVEGVIAEGDNLLQAAAMGLYVPQLWALTAVYILQAYPIAESLGTGEQWMPVLQTAVAAAPTTNDPLTIQLLNRLGRAYRLSQQPKKAVATHQQALRQTEPAAPAWVVAEVHLNLAEDYQAQYDIATAEHHAQQAHQLIANSPEQYTKIKAATQNILGILYLQKGQLALAESHLLAALHLWPDQNNPVALARLTKNLALSLSLQGKHETSLFYYHNALDKIRAIGNAVDQAEIENNLGVLYLQIGESNRAEAIFNQALHKTLPATCRAPIRASITHNLGEVYLAQNRLFEAGLYIQQAILDWQQLGDQLEMGNSIGVYGIILHRQGHYKEAIPKLETALSSLSQLPNRGRVAELTQEFSQELAQCRLAT